LRDEDEETLGLPVGKFMLAPTGMDSTNHTLHRRLAIDTTADYYAPFNGNYVSQFGVYKIMAKQSTVLIFINYSAI